MAETVACIFAVPAKVQCATILAIASFQVNHRPRHRVLERWQTYHAAGHLEIPFHRRPDIGIAAGLRILRPPESARAQFPDPALNLLARKMHIVQGKRTREL